LGENRSCLELSIRQLVELNIPIVVIQSFNFIIFVYFHIENQEETAAYLVDSIRLSSSKDHKIMLELTFKEECILDVEVFDVQIKVG
jgi:hypothetical protein